MRTAWIFQSLMPLFVAAIVGYIAYRFYSRFKEIYQELRGG